MALHPLDPLTVDEITVARQIVLDGYPDKVIDFREIYLHEPAKAELQDFLLNEHNGKLDASTKRPERLATCQYDVIGNSKIPQFHESTVDLARKEIRDEQVVDVQHHASLTLKEFDELVEACKASSMFQEALSELTLPEGFEAIVEPWPYGALDPSDPNQRYFQGMCFAQDKRLKNEDSNFYAYPLPLIPIMDATTKKIVRVDRPATGGKGDPLTGQTHAKGIIDHCVSSEYVPELLSQGTRSDLQPLNVVQPNGPSFSTKGNLIEWQKWRFRVGFNPREGATIHDVYYDGRSVLYRLSVSEMTVPYADPRPPYHRKQAFDFGDGGAGNCANNLSLGCDCLGVIKYFDGVITDSAGNGKVAPNVVCLHEQDNGIAWKHTNWRTGRAVVTRHRELVVQFIITLANYEYIFAYKFDQSGGITVETRATGIVSVVNIDANKSSEWGNVVASGALAQNHQHIFAVRIDPAIDGSQNTVLEETSHPVPISPERNPNGNFYEVRQNILKESQWLDAAPQHNQVIKMINPNKKNPISGKPVGYKFMPAPTQLLLADIDSIQSKRALFARHHTWVTKYKDGELYAGGKYTLQSQNEVGGVSDAVSRKEPIENDDVVVWSVFGLTHNPRVEDWPVMPVEIHELHIKPADFFTANPSLDVPSNANLTSKLVQDSCCS
ncbi:hypothetical protein VTL71DRAFT_16524 [Oculimacula yallundae]|uniref:Amine oxidase n=1 Tax=Oculimacula yallundae TaxID=86028 RepID=A0ABR4CEN7_9HELO